LECELLLLDDAEWDSVCEEGAAAAWADEVGPAWVDGADWKFPRVGGVGFAAPLLAVIGVVLEAGFGAVFCALLSSELADEAVAPRSMLLRKIFAARLHFGLALTILNSGSEGEPRASIF